MSKLYYISPQTEIIEFDRSEDVITSSGSNGNNMDHWHNEYNEHDMHDNYRPDHMNWH